MFQYPFICAPLTLVCLLVFGCAAASSAGGGNRSLKDRSIQQISVQLANGQSICPDTDTPLVVVAYESGGKRFVTEGAAQGRIASNEFIAEAFSKQPL